MTLKKGDRIVMLVNFGDAKFKGVRATVRRVVEDVYCFDADLKIDGWGKAYFELPIESQTFVAEEVFDSPLYQALK